ncbi:hypothetical protein N9839_00300 [Flavobacteriaceae bacterium]|nr:hypothetical protein [Flavobacteriaceae bacterium]
MRNLLQKGKTKNGTATAQKQECGPFPATILSQPHTCFFYSPRAPMV